MCGVTTDRLTTVLVISPAGCFLTAVEISRPYKISRAHIIFLRINEKKNINIFCLQKYDHHQSHLATYLLRRYAS